WSCGPGPCCGWALTVRSLLRADGCRYRLRGESEVRSAGVLRDAAGEVQRGRGIGGVQLTHDHPAERSAGDAGCGPVVLADQPLDALRRVDADGRVSGDPEHSRRARCLT